MKTQKEIKEENFKISKLINEILKEIKDKKIIIHSDKSLSF